MRIAVLGVAHETNTFSRVVTDYAKFVADGIIRGQELWAAHATAHTTLAGFLSVGDLDDVEVVPLIWAWANPSGTVTASAFEAITSEMLDLLRHQGPWDAVLLAQHGAMVSEQHRDADAEVVRRVRALVGAIPIGVAIDLHANVSAELVAESTVVVGFLTNPHVDARVRATECAELIVRAVRGEIRPVTGYRRIPAVINILRHATGEQPMHDLIGAAIELAGRPAVLSTSLFEGYQWADVDQMGMSCLVITDGDSQLAQVEADRLAGLVWARRDEFQGNAVQPKEAITRSHENGPVVLLDVGDNIGAGGDGSSTALLEAILGGGATGSATIIYDPAAVAKCTVAGVGGSLTMAIGNTTEGRDAVVVHGIVRAVVDGHYEEPTPTHGGFRYFDMGQAAVIGLFGDNLVLLTSRLTLPTSTQQLRAAGIDPAQRTLIVAKGVVSPQAGYASVASEFVLVDTPGVTSADLTGFTYVHRRTPLHPFESVPPELAP